MFVSCKTRHNKDGSWWAVAREHEAKEVPSVMGRGSSEDEAVDQAVESLQKICRVDESGIVRMHLGSHENRMMSEDDVSLFEPVPEADDRDLDDDDWDDDDDEEEDYEDDIESFCSRELAEELINRFSDVKAGEIGEWFSPNAVAVFLRLQKRLNELL
jgi:hypothetical protein